jgi:hypothetical protein
VTVSQSGIVIDESLSSLINGVETLLKFPDEAGAMGRRGNALLRDQYGVSAVAKEAIQAYEGVGRDEER